MDDAGPTLADLLASAVGSVEFEGKTLSVSEPTVEQMLEFQLWLESRARAALNTDAESDEADRRADRSELNDKIACGHFEFYGEVATRARRTFSGQAKLYEILFRSQGVTPEAAGRLVREKAEEVAELFRRAVLDGEHDAGKVLGALVAPLLRTYGLPSDFLSAAFSTGTGHRPSPGSAGSPSGGSSPSGAPPAGTGTGSSGPPTPAAAP